MVRCISTRKWKPARPVGSAGGRAKSNDCGMAWWRSYRVKVSILAC